MAASSGAADGGTKSSSKTATKASGAGTKTKKTVRKKKPTSKSSGASSNQAIYSAARTAQMELAGQRSAAAARLSDPLWYRVEDVLPAATEETPMALPGPKVLPDQVNIVESALANNNLTRSDVTPQAFCVLLEQARRYALEILADAQDYAVCASRTEITKPDLELASHMRPDHPISTTVELPKLNLFAQQINRIPLPPIPSQCYSGVLLPPKRHQLTARTFDVVSGAQVTQRMVQPPPSIATRKISSSSKSAPKPSYGAARGRQIPIQLKEREPPMEEGTPAASAPSGPTPMDVSPSTAPTNAATTATPAPTATAGAPGSAGVPANPTGTPATQPTAVPAAMPTAPTPTQPGAAPTVPAPAPGPPGTGGVPPPS